MLFAEEVEEEEEGTTVTKPFCPRAALAVSANIVGYAPAPEPPPPDGWSAHASRYADSTGSYESSENILSRTYSSISSSAVRTRNGPTLPRNGIAVDDDVGGYVEADAAWAGGTTRRSEPVVGAGEKRNIIEKDARITARDRRAARAMDRSRRREAGGRPNNDDDGVDPRAATAVTTTATRLCPGSIPGGRYDRCPGTANDDDIDDDENDAPRAAMAGGGMGDRKASTRRRPPPPPPLLVVRMMAAMEASIRSGGAAIVGRRVGGGLAIVVFGMMIIVLWGERMEEVGGSTDLGRNR